MSISDPFDSLTSAKLSRQGSAHVTAMLPHDLFNECCGLFEASRGQNDLSMAPSVGLTQHNNLTPHRHDRTDTTILCRLSFVKPRQA